MAQDVITCAAVLQAIAGKDERDALSSKIPFDEVPDYVSACKRGALRNARIGRGFCFILAIRLTVLTLRCSD
jgi:amidase